MFATIAGLLLVLAALQDSFEALVLPRRVTRRWRIARLYYRSGWMAWRRLCQLIPAGRHRQDFLSVFGPLSLLGLFACWVTVLITGFALIHFGFGTLPPERPAGFRDYLYHSGETFFTLGYGDVTPATYTGKLLAVVEAGTGFGFMAIVIGYLPVLYQAFSRRERTIALMDARAGSPPAAGELLRRIEQTGDDGMAGLLAEWEEWSAELLESHLSFPVLSFYRSQHDNQSWLAAVATVLDASAVLLVTGTPKCQRRAELTFAMARHACVDLCLVFWLPPRMPAKLRLADDELAIVLRTSGEQGGADSTAQRDKLRQLQSLYEPFLQAMSDYFMFSLPRYFPERAAPDNWQTSAWMARAPRITELPAATPDQHFG